MFFGGLSIKKDEEVLKRNCPHVVVGTPGRILALVRSRSLNLRNVKHFVLDECDKMLEQLGEPRGPAGGQRGAGGSCSPYPSGCLCPRRPSLKRLEAPWQAPWHGWRRVSGLQLLPRASAPAPVQPLRRLGLANPEGGQAGAAGAQPPSPAPADMRRDVQEIFRLTPHEKQCMMFSATLSKEIRPVCRKFMQDVSREQGPRSCRGRGRLRRPD